MLHVHIAGQTFAIRSIPLHRVERTSVEIGGENQTVAGGGDLELKLRPGKTGDARQTQPSVIEMQVRPLLAQLGDRLFARAGVCRQRFDLAQFFACRLVIGVEFLGCQRLQIAVEIHPPHVVGHVRTLRQQGQHAPIGRPARLDVVARMAREIDRRAFAVHIDDEDVGAEIKIVLGVGNAGGTGAPPPMQAAIPSGHQTPDLAAPQIQQHQIAEPATKGQVRPVRRRAGPAVVVFGAQDRRKVEPYRVMPALRVELRCHGLSRLSLRGFLVGLSAGGFLGLPLFVGVVFCVRAGGGGFVGVGRDIRRSRLRFDRFGFRFDLRFLHCLVKGDAQLGARGAHRCGIDRVGAVLIAAEVEGQSVGRPGDVPMPRV